MYTDNDIKKIAERLRFLRESLNLTVEDAAAAAMVSTEDYL